MATLIPRIGQRSLLNSGLAGSLKIKSINTNTLNSPEYFSNPGSDIVFNTQNDNKMSNNPKGILEQIRIDNSGNIAYFGTKVPSLNRTIADVSLNLDCYNRINDIYISSKVIDTPFFGSDGVRVTLEYESWDNKYVSVAGDVLCTIKNPNAADSYTCVGEFIKLNQSSPNSQYFNTSTTGLVVNNGTVNLSSQSNTFSKIPYGLVFRFKPSFNPISIFSIHIKVVSSTTQAQIKTITVDANPPP